MKKLFKSLIVFVLLGSLMFSLGGCASNEGDEELGSEVGSEKEKEKEKKEEKVGTRSNPIGLGEEVEWELKFYPDTDDWDRLEGLAKLSLNKVYEGEEALDMLYFKEEALDDVEDGYTYAVADISVSLLEGDEDNPYTTSFTVGSVSGDGRESPSSYESLTDEYEENEYTDLYPGGEVNILRAFLVPEDGDYLVEVEENISGNKFFNHE